MLSNKTMNDIKFIADHYGYSQYGQTIEECSELILAIRKYQRMIESGKLDINDLKKLKDHIIEEMADVYCMIEQLKYIIPTSTDNIESLIDSKVERQLKRIEQNQ